MGTTHVSMPLAILAAALFGAMTPLGESLIGSLGTLCLAGRLCSARGSP